MKKSTSEMQWSLITDASSGIGREYANELARRGKNLILVARNEDKLKRIGELLETEHGIQIKYIATDLSDSKGIKKLIDGTDGLQVNTLINNAGKEESGNFLDLDAAEMLNSIALNCSAPLLLTHHFAKLMASNGGGNILFLLSIVAFQGVPNIANYAATKAYLLTLAEGISAEFKNQGVKVSIAAPGFTESNLAPHQNFNGTPMKPMQADFVAKYTLDRLGKKQLIIPGVINKFLFYSGKYLQPRRLGSWAFGRVFTMVLRDKLSKHNASGAQV